MSLEDLSSTKLKIIHLYKSARCLALSHLSQAIQLRCFQTAEAALIKLPDNAYKQQTCPQCSITWIPGLTVRIRIRLGNPKRKSGGVSKRGRLRTIKKKHSKGVSKEKGAEIAQSLVESYHRKRSLVYECLACNEILVNDLGRVIPDLKSSTKQTNDVLNKREHNPTENVDQNNSTKRRKIVEGIATQTATSQTRPEISAKKRAKERKTKSSLQYLLAKSKGKTNDSGKLGLSDFLKPN